MAFDILAWMTANPKVSIIVFSALITLISTAVTAWLTDQEHMKEMKARQKELNKQLKTAKPGEKLFKEIQAEIMQITGTMMKAQFKPMLVTIVPFLILFAWLRNTYEPLMGGYWIAYYIVSSIVFSTIYRKVFKMA